MDIHEKIKLLGELKANPLSDINSIQRLAKSLDWVDLNQLSVEEIKILLNN